MACSGITLALRTQWIVHFRGAEYPYEAELGRPIFGITLLYRQMDNDSEVRLNSIAIIADHFRSRYKLHKFMKSQVRLYLYLTNYFQ
jgi:hypothetical protein